MIKFKASFPEGVYHSVIKNKGDINELIAMSKEDTGLARITFFSKKPFKRLYTDNDFLNLKIGQEITKIVL